MNKIGLALSGGGFRASLYHLGLVRFLRDAGVLSQVTHITSVSGGSILAAHLALNWDRYNGSSNEFDSAAAEVLEFVRMDVRNRVVRRFPLTFPLRWSRRLVGKSNRKLTRTGLLEYHYEKHLYGDTSLFQLPESPQLHLLTTNLSEGCLCSFNRDGMIMVRRQPGNGVRLDRVRLGLATVAMAVTASSAFPGFFPPLELTGADVGTKSGEFDRQAYTDGAVFDNLGVRMFRCLERQSLADGDLTRDDFLDFPEAVEALRQAGTGGRETPLGRLTQLLMTGGPRLALPQMANGGVADAEVSGHDPVQPYLPPAPEARPGAEDWLLGRLSYVLHHYQLDRDPLFGDLTPSDHHAAATLKAGQLDGRTLAKEDQLWLNRHLLDAAFRQATGHRCFRRLNRGLDGVLVSDVGKPFEVQTAHAGGLIRTALRASDILMDRVWQLETETFADGPGFVFAPITEVVKPSEDLTAIHPEIQRQVAGIRTDFDRFSELEISNLVRHGYCVARKACGTRPDLFGDHLPGGPPWDPAPRSHGAAATAPAAARPAGASREPAAATVEARALQTSSFRRIWSTLLDRRDWTSYVYVPLIIPIVVMLPYFTVKYFERSHRLNQLINSLSQGSRDLEQMSHLLEHGPEPRWSGGAAAEEVAKLDEPSVHRFEVIQDSWITDLRAWKPSHSDKNDADSYVHHYRRLLVAMRPDTVENSIFEWPLLARDPKADFRFPRQQMLPKLKKCNDVKNAAPGERECRWELDYDFRDVPPGEPVNLIVEYQSAGRFLQHTDGTTTVPLNVRGDTTEMTAWILLPKGMEYANFRVIRHPKGTQEKAEAVRVITRYLAEDSTIIAFKMLSVSGNHDYEVSWTYK
ncbi:MAG TPA: patatin-like phospholipase family protein [Gemmataceae bacterium]|nr:patatin-like phospholipase family protein [Gemmataceae bacterium]